MAVAELNTVSDRCVVAEPFEPFRDSQLPPGQRLPQPSWLKVNEQRGIKPLPRPLLPQLQTRFAPLE